MRQLLSATLSTLAEAVVVGCSASVSGSGPGKYAEFTGRNGFIAGGGYVSGDVLV
jgi:hypothetical protein